MLLHLNIIEYCFSQARTNYFISLTIPITIIFTMGSQANEFLVATLENN